MEAWGGFFTASAGAAATLAGLLVVAISINLNRIMGVPGLPNRAAAALVPLGGILTVSMLALVPLQPVRRRGGAIFFVGGAVGVGSAYFQIRSFQIVGAPPPPSLLWSHVVLHQVQNLPVVVGGFLMLNQVQGGLYWLVPGVIACLLGGILNAWVLLIEILR